MTSWTVAAGAFLLIGLTVADVVWSPRYMRRVRAAVAAGDEAARTGMYRLLMSLSWAMAACALALMLVGGLSLAEIGFRAPSAGGLERWGAILVGLGAGALVMIVLTSRGRAPTQPVGDVDVLLPRGRVERRYFAAVSVTAGVTEEIVYRALALSVLLALLPGRQVVALVTAALVFGLAHLYQGWGGVLYTSALALLLGQLYLDTQSVLPVMAVHVVIDLLALRAKPRTPTVA